MCVGGRERRCSVAAENLINLKVNNKKKENKTEFQNKIIEIGPNITVFSINKNGRERISE